VNILIIGAGGREHAIAAALAKNPAVETIYAVPGNGGMAAFCECVPELKATQLEEIREFALAHNVRFAVPAADDPLVAGAVDVLEAAGIACFGPSRAAARIEGSKVFSKNLMKQYHIPTADYAVFHESAAALAYLEEYETYPVVLKADGLALGKGVIIAQNRREAQDAVRLIMEDKKFGASGSQIVIEEFLTGPEVTVLSFCDGETCVPMVASMDHKRARDNDEGLNTGGMGVVAPNPCYTPEIAARCAEEIFAPTLAAMRAEGAPFKGCLYFGLMLTPHGPRVIEYNCRFGDPECQTILPLLESDLLTVMRACREGGLAGLEIRWKAAHACCVVLASGGYPEQYGTGYPICFGDTGEAIVYHAGTKRREDGAVVTAGGRVLNVVALGAGLREAVEAAYRAAGQITFQDAFYRRDIGQRALEALLP
jgi:phosphoribosylamine--glycine ligase